MDVMIGAIKPQLPKHTTGVVTFAKIRPILPLEMGKEACQQTKGVSGHSKEPSLKSFPNM
jgi:hypothetical protein